MSLTFTASARYPMSARERVAPVEVHAFDERVGGQHLKRAPLRLHYRRIVANPDDERDGGSREAPPDSIDERALTVPGCR